ncbi:MAG: ABC transporter substrate-binding protein [Chloroflexi bacterium]|nr:ABC transporter substrate-binding protein [Chloroflexota bacterium]
MTRKILWLVVSSLMALSLVLAGCAPAATPPTPPTTTPPTTTPPTTTPPTITPPVAEPPQKEAVAPTAEAPKYGGTLRLALAADITNFDDVVTVGFGHGLTNSLTNENMWTGDWAKGPAGGYGTKETDWIGIYDVFENHTGTAAESWKWSVDGDKGTLVYQVRQGVHYGLNPKSEASRLVNGREMTADDVIFSLKQVITDTRAYVYRAYPELRDAQITKTGPWEVTIKTSTAAGLITAVAKFGSYVLIVPPEVVAKYGDMSKWQNAVGTGPFLLTEYVAGSQALLPRNPNYWRRNPVGPGKGNEVPYIDALQYLIIPDASTRLAALRTGRLDRMTNLSFEDADQMKKTAPKMVSGEGTLGGPAQYVYMNSQRAPFNNVKVRRAALMAVDLETIRTSLNHGLGQLLTWPAELVPSYKDLYLGLDDPEMPASVKELYTYNPTKAKELLKEAGYPNGFKVTATIGSTEADYFAIIKDMWSKAGIELTLDIKESGTLRSTYNTGNYDIVGSAGGRGPISVFYHMVTMVGTGPAGGNGAQITDPVINKASDEMQRLYLTDPKGAMRIYKDLMKYVLDQAYVVSRPIYPQTTFWWPWLKAYSGEQSVGYFMYETWATWVWIDQDLKKSMGY